MVGLRFVRGGAPCRCGAVPADTGATEAWANYKLRCSDWYVDLLDQFNQDCGFERFVGIEMTLDGALASLYSAFDAAVAGVIVTAEELRQQRVTQSGGKPPDRLPPHLYWWSNAKKFLIAPDVVEEDDLRPRSRTSRRSYASSTSRGRVSSRR